MCGIYASVSKTGPASPSQGLRSLLYNRGPDHLEESLCNIQTNDGDLSLSFTSTVLALRGGHVTKQPLIDFLTGSILCWNGEAWGIGQNPVQGNDGEEVLNLLTSSTHGLAKLYSITAVLEVIRSITGPFAFVYFDKTHEILYFGRDRLGRRSLLTKTDGFNATVQFSSLADTAQDTWVEVEADGIYILALSGKLIYPSAEALPEDSFHSSYFETCRVPWRLEMPNSSTDPLGAFFNDALSEEVHILDANSDSVKQLEYHLYQSLELRVLDIPIPPHPNFADGVKVAVLFSGGLDCTVLARIAHDLMPLDETIDLLNVAFENPRVVKAANSRSDASNQYEVKDSISPYESCPDRITGRKAVEELRKICPGRIWRFVAINVPYTETSLHRDKVVQLIYPHNTEMDLSIAYALYFAARGSGLASIEESNLEPIEYMTPARVLLSGLGADELFGGYTRHATAFERRGIPGLLGELKIDYMRLGKRNLGRDDRVIANWGRETRYPYLDESLVKWALSKPVWCKCGFNTREQNQDEANAGLEPNKKVLRLLARQLGMVSVAKEKKRAIQFGARTAKMETGRTKGTSQIS